MQTTGMLNLVNESAGHSYCCLGVACVVAEEHGINIERYEGKIRGVILTDTQEKVKNALGISTAGEDKLAFLNDGGMSFKSIASYIRKYPTEIFIQEETNVKAN